MNREIANLKKSNSKSRKEAEKLWAENSQLKESSLKSKAEAEKLKAENKELTGSRLRLERSAKFLEDLYNKLSNESAEIKNKNQKHLSKLIRIQRILGE